MPLPQPAGEVILDVVHGATTFSFDMELLGQLDTAELLVHEPFLDEDVPFAGVPMESLLALVGAQDAVEVRLIALDDYTVTLTIDELQSSLLATHQDGGLMGLDEGGPIRLLHLGDDATARNTDNWIWSIRTMEIT